MLGGYRYVFCDSAGIRSTDDAIEKMGVELARERISWADLVLLVVDASSQENEWQELSREIRGRGARVWLVVNKIDLNPSAIGQVFCDSTVCAQNFYVSVKTAAGVDALVKALIDEVRVSLPDTAHANNVVTNERQRSCIERSRESIAKALQGLADKTPLEFVSEDVRQALSSLEELVGKTYSEDILGRIFSKFCIGK